MLLYCHPKQQVNVVSEFCVFMISLSIRSLSVAMTATNCLAVPCWVSSLLQCPFFFYHSFFSPPVQHTLLNLCSSHCYKEDPVQRNSNCPVCSRHLNDLAHPLPYAHCANSRLICTISGHSLNEHNPPMMLPNGNIYGLSVSTVCRAHAFWEIRVGCTFFIAVSKLAFLRPVNQCSYIREISSQTVWVGGWKQTIWFPCKVWTPRVHALCAWSDGGSKRCCCKERMGTFVCTHWQLSIDFAGVKLLVSGEITQISVTRGRGGCGFCEVSMVHRTWPW